MKIVKISDQISYYMGDITIPVYFLIAIPNVNLIHIKRWVLDLLTVMEEKVWKKAEIKKCI